MNTSRTQSPALQDRPANLADSSASARMAGRARDSIFSLPSAESKFVGTADQEEYVLAWLRHVCLPDPGHPDAVISSLYYDTPALDAYHEKIDGDFLKTKCRLRWYEPDISPDPALRTAFLEVKHKIGTGRRKTRVRLEMERFRLDHADLDNPVFREILDRHAASLEEWLPSGLTPAGVVTYRRRRFICPFTLSRICLDTAIGLGRVNERLLPRLGPVLIGSIVLEIKDGGRAQIPWLGPLAAAGVRQRSFSKYAACIAHLLKEA